MTLSALARQRLHRQHISSPLAAGIEDVVRRLGAVQAQDFRGALWSVALRTRGATEKEVERALAERKIVRTWPMRGTLHFVPPEDVRWMLALLTPRVLASSRKRLERSGLTARIILKSEKVISSGLEGGRQLTREELMAILEKAKLPTDASRGLHLVWHAAQQGLICFGPLRGKQQTFALLDDWIGPGKTLSGDEALAELARRYFTGHGPATLQDFSWWTGLTLVLARKALESVKAQLHTQSLNGKIYWFSEPPRLRVEPQRRAYLLPGFDEYLLGYRDRSVAIATEDAPKFTVVNGLLPATVVMDGRVIGTWKRTLGKAATLAVVPFRPLSRTEKKAIAVTANRYGDFVDYRIQLDL